MKFANLPKIIVKFIIALIIIGLLPMDTFWLTLTAKAQDSKQTSIMNAATLGPVTQKEDLSLNGVVRALNQSAKKMDWVVKLQRAKIGFNQYDDAEILSKTIVLAQMLENNPTYKADYQKNGNIPQQLLKDLDISFDPNKIDIRVVGSLVNLVLPKEMGGAGHDWIKVGSITKGYTSKQTASPLKEMDNDQLKTLGGGSIEKGMKSAANIYSPHYKEVGQGVDITEIDYLQGTKFVYQDNELVSKEKLPPVPIQVGWQTNEGQGQAIDIPQQFGQSLKDLAGNFIPQELNSTLTKWLSESRIDDLNLGNKSLGTNMANIIENLGKNWYNQTWDLPDGYKFPNSLGNIGEDLGKNLFGTMINNAIPSSGLSGSSWPQMETNAGAAVVAKRLGLPDFSFPEGLTNSDLILANIGQKFWEEKVLSISAGTLKNLNNGDINQLKELIGEGFWEQQLGFSTGDLAGQSVDAIKTQIGATRWQNMVDDKSFLNNLLYLNPGVTDLMAQDPVAFKKAIGEQVIKRNIINIAPDRRDEVLGVAEPEKQNITSDFLSAKTDVFKTIGINRVAKALSLNADEQKNIRSWLATKTIEKDVAIGNIPKIDEAALAKKFQLKPNDLNNIFVKDEGKLVFGRVGKVAWTSAISPTKEIDKSANDTIVTSPTDEFIQTKFEQIKQAAIKLAKQSPKKDVVDLSQQIVNIADGTKAGDTIGDTIFDPFTNRSANSIDSIFDKITAITRVESNSLTQEIINAGYEIIEGMPITAPESISQDNLKFTNRPALLEPTFIDAFGEVMSGKKKFDDFITNDLGLTYFATSVGLPDPSQLATAWQKIKTNSSQDPVSIVKNLFGDQTLNDIRDTMNNGFGLSSWESQNNYYKLDITSMAQFLSGNVEPFIRQIGSYAVDKMANFSAQYGSKDIASGKIALKTANQFAGLNMFTQHYLGMFEQASIDGDIANNVAQLYFAENVGLSKAFLDTNNYIKDPKNLVSMLYAFNVKPPTSLGNNPNVIVDWAKSNQPWNKAENQVGMLSKVSYLGLGTDSVKKLFDGAFSGKVDSGLLNELAAPEKTIIKDRISSEKLKEGIGLDTIDDATMGNLVTNLQKIFDPNSSGNALASFADLALQKINSDDPFKSQGYSYLAKIFANDDNNNEQGITSGLAALAYWTIAPNGTNQATQDIIVDTVNLFTGTQQDKTAAQDRLAEALTTKLTAAVPAKIGDFDTKGLIDHDTIKKDLISLFSSGGGNPGSTVFPVAGAIQNITDYSNSLNDLGLKVITDSDKGLIVENFGSVVPQYQNQMKAAGVYASSAEEKKAIYDNIINNDALAKNATDALAGKPNLTLPVDGVNTQMFDINQIGKYIQTEFQKKVEEIKKTKLDELATSQMDKYLMDQKIPPIANALLKGTESDKQLAIKNYVIYYLNNGQGVAKWGVTIADTLSESLIKHQPVDKAKLGSAFDVAMKDLFKLDNVPPGLGQGLAEWVTPGGNSNALKTALKDNAILYGTTLLDKTLKIPLGSTYTMYSAWNSYTQALNGYHAATAEVAKALAASSDTTQLVNNAKTLVKAEATSAAKLAQFKATTANIVIMAVNLVFGETFNKIDQQIGLPSGTTSLVVSVVLYSILAGVSLAAAAAIFWPAIAILVLGEVFGLFGGQQKQKTTKVEVVYTACKYWPGFDSGPPSDIAPECPAEFHGETQADFAKGAQTAANHVIKNRLLYNLLNMGERMDDKEMLPTRIETFSPDHVSYLSGVADKIYGDGTAGSMAKLIQEGSRRGFGPNKTLWDRVLYSY